MGYELGCTVYLKNQSKKDKRGKRKILLIFSQAVIKQEEGFVTMAAEMPPPSLVCAIGAKGATLSDDDIKSHLIPFLESLGPREDVLILPPDYTRLPSQAGKITRFISDYYNFTTTSTTTTTTMGSGASNDEPASKKAKSNASRCSESRPDITILPALGTHAPMTSQQIRSMFGDALAEKQPDPFVVHDWRSDVVTIGTAPADMVRSATKAWSSRSGRRSSTNWCGRSAIMIHRSNLTNRLF